MDSEVFAEIRNMVGHDQFTVRGTDLIMDDGSTAPNISAFLDADNNWLPIVNATTLREYLADKRWRVETGGIIVSGIKVITDDIAQRKISELRRRSEAGEVALPFPFKSADGWASLDLASIQAIDQAVAAYVQACYATEAELDGKIESAMITSNAQIDAANWPG